jgi:hypothetical protein
VFGSSHGKPWCYKIKKAISTQQTTPTLNANNKYKILHKWDLEKKKAIRWQIVPGEAMHSRLRGTREENLVIYSDFGQGHICLVGINFTC